MLKNAQVHILAVMWNVAKDMKTKRNVPYLRSRLCFLSNLKIKPLNCPINKSRKWMPFLRKALTNTEIKISSRLTGPKDVNINQMSILIYLQFHSGLWWGF